MFKSSFQKIFLLMVVFLTLDACTPAKYKGWSGGNDYFNHLSQSKQTSTSVKSSKKNSSQIMIEDCPDSYRVKKGDTLSGISQRCAIKQATIVRINQLLPPFWLEVDQQLTLRLAKGVVEKAIPKNDFSWPLKNKRLNYQFVSDASGLTSLTIHAPLGTAIYAVSAGEVVYAGEGIKHFGKLIIIKHPNGYLTLYAHNRSLKVVEGQIVKQQQLIATLGHSGNVTKPQLYFEVRYRGTKVDAKINFKKE